MFRVNKDGKFTTSSITSWPRQKQLSEPEAIRISGEDPDYYNRQVWDAIEEGKEILWKANVQIMQLQDADAKS